MLYTANIYGVRMSSAKQGKGPVVLLVAALCYVLYMLANLFVIQLPFAWLSETLEFRPDPLAIAFLSIVILCDLALLVWITILAARTLVGRLSPARFCLVTISSFLTFLALAYISLVIANTVFNMGWSIL